MTELLTAAQMRAIEEAAIASGEVTGLELMERAGRGVVEAIFEEWPELKATSHRAVVLCGPGNNGGDGFVVARLLKEWGWEVEVFLYGDPERLPTDARVNYERWRGMGEVRPINSYLYNGLGWNCDILVDALFGSGLSRALPELSELFWNMWDMACNLDVEFGHPRGRPAIVAVDLPSGLSADTGECFPHSENHNPFAASATLTVTFHAPKVGHFQGEGPILCGKVVVKDIGL
jgi:ADP-dependent NAD(P)H-hydrate dehydratase / NAD(P)H-hydrate epimerase